MKSSHFDFDLRKKITFKIASEVFNLFEVRDIETMIQKNIRFYDVLNENMPELLEYMRSNGRANQLTAEYVKKLLENGLEEFLTKYLPKFNGLYEKNPDAKKWLDSQIQHVLRVVWNF